MRKRFIAGKCSSLPPIEPRGSAAVKFAISDFSMHDYVIIGGGIVGLATAMAVGNKHPEASILVLEKEQDLAKHQTGRNSGVIHSGIYYKPGSLKARFAREGNRSMVEFCREHGIKHEVCGKVIVATKESELPLLDNLFQRGLDHGLAVARLAPEQVREIEPHVRCLAGVRVLSTGIVNYREVSAKYVEQIELQGGTVQIGTRVDRLREVKGTQVVETSRGEFEAGFIINCAGLFSDRVARFGGLDSVAKIVPFRGEYHELVPERRYLVKHLVYPVPNPSFPFLGVHFTRMINNSVHAGPNAVLAFKREGYRRTDINCADLFETLTFPGFWKLARKHYRDGIMEMLRSVSKRAFIKGLQQLIPEVTEDDLVPTHSGVRAQALMPDGKLVDDFLVVNGKNSIHVCNAPSPAATASLEIGRFIANQLPEVASGRRPPRINLANQQACKVNELA
jgi:(S)-2-hydroxyglutarate dehydrogenase